ncbi:MAG: DNA polymerase [Terrisporobacter sp.]
MVANTLAIDIETFSDVDLSKSGVYAYCNSPAFQILLFAYAFNNEEVKIVDLARGEKLPQYVVSALLDEYIIKTAFNANFERVCISKYLNIELNPRTWNCTAVQCAMLSLPHSLEKVGEVLQLEKGKLKEGKDLIKFFTILNKNKRNLPEDNLEKWELFKKYCIRDVVVEREIRKMLVNFPLNDDEVENYIMDIEINNRGILVDKELVHNAIECNEKFNNFLINRAYELTKLSNPNSPAQLKKWLFEKGIEVCSLDRKNVKDLLSVVEDDEIREVLKLRLLMSKTSIKKYEAIEKSVCSDNRVRGLFQFYGASRTGRWAGRLVQVQNLPKNYMEDLDNARNILKSGKYEDIERFYDSTTDVLSQLIRTAFIPKEGHEFIVADFSAIEARVLAWISNEKWRLDVFKGHGKIYEASASNMFKVPLEEITKDSILRQKGKIAELALGYGGSVGALIAMGALDMGLDEKELSPLVAKYRRNNPSITKFWWDVHKMAIYTVKKGISTSVNKINFYYKDKYLFIELPSKRKLTYINPSIEINKFNSESVVYKGIGTNKKWGPIETYGPKLVENIVQAISRDILAHAMRNIRDKGFDIVMHVHDEVVLEVEKDKHSVEEVCEIMTLPPMWGMDLPLSAEGYKCKYYIKM